MPRIYTLRLRPNRKPRYKPPTPVRAPVPEPEPIVETVTEPETPDFAEMLKVDVVALAEERGIDSSGTKADIVARLEASDD